MSENTHDLELAEVFGFVLSSQATNRARFTVILKILARILAQLEDRDQEEVLAELRQMFADEKAAQSDELKDYLRRKKAPRVIG